MCPKSLRLWPFQQHFSNISAKGIQDVLLEVLFSKNNLKYFQAVYNHTGNFTDCCHVNYGRKTAEGLIVRGLINKDVSI